MGKTKQVSVTRTPGATAYWTVYNYDALGRTTSVVQPNSSGTTTYAYAGNKVTVTDPAGAWKAFYTDSSGNLTQVTEPNPAGGNFDTFYSYTALNQLTTVSMTRPAVPGPGGTVTQTRTFNYNGGVLLQSATNPENGTTTYTYNADSTIATKTDAKGQVLTYLYDSMGRLSQVKNGTTVLRTFTYDANGGYGQNLAGRLARVDFGAASPNTWTELYSYHPAGAVLKKALVMSRTGYTPGALEASWTYDDEGQATSVKYPDTFGATGPTYTYTFDQMSRPIGLSNGAAPNNIASGATYGPAGQLTNLNYGGINEGRSYNVLNQLTGIGSSAGSITYSYSATNNDGRITGMTSTISGETVTYAYDSLKRLITADAGSLWTLSFTYDGFGNRLTQQGSQPMYQSYDMATNRLMGQGYDNNGNMTSMGAFDVENRLVSSGNDTYDYGIDNKRIYKAVTGATNTEEVYFYAGGRRIGTYTPSYGYPDVNGNIPITFAQTSYNVYFGGKLIISGGQAVVLDRLGSVVARANIGGGFEKHAYFPYGEERTSSANNRDKFGTYFRDAWTGISGAAGGLDYADQRYYGSAMGRFLSVDPDSTSSKGGQPGSWNKYSYVKNDPANRRDQHGTSDCDPDDPDDCFEPVYCWISGSPVYEETICLLHGFNRGEGDASHFQSGGSGRINSVEWTSLRMSDPNSLIDLTFQTIAQDLASDADCARWLAGGNGTGSINNIRNMNSSAAVGFASSNAIVAQYPNGDFYVANKPIKLIFNLNSCFFLQGPPALAGTKQEGVNPCPSAPGSKGLNPEITAGTAAYRALVALHELAHVFGLQSGGDFILNDGGDPNTAGAAQALNNDSVWNHCRKTLNLELSR